MQQFIHSGNCVAVLVMLEVAVIFSPRRQQEKIVEVVSALRQPICATRQ
jgi:hypothetical protein